MLPIIIPIPGKLNAATHSRRQHFSLPELGSPALACGEVEAIPRDEGKRAVSLSIAVVLPPVMFLMHRNHNLVHSVKQISRQVSSSCRISHCPGFDCPQLFCYSALTVVGKKREGFSISHRLPPLYVGRIGKDDTYQKYGRSLLHCGLRPRSKAPVNLSVDGGPA